jgi:hypothetical protein
MRLELKLNALCSVIQRERLENPRIAPKRPKLARILP